MSNLFNTRQELAEYSTLFLSNKLGLANRVSRRAQEKYVAGVGSTVKIPIRSPLGAAKRYTAGSGSITAADVQESSADIVLTDHVYQAAKLTATNSTLDVRDFSSQVLFPLVESVALDIDTMVARTMDGWARNLVGTAGTVPSTVAHVTAGVGKLKSNKVNADAGFMAAISTTAWQNMMGAVEMKSRDYGDQKPTGLMTGQLSPVSGVSEFFDTQTLGTLDQGDIAGTVLVKGASQTGTSIIVDGFTSATGHVRTGTRLTFNGDTTVYTVTEDCAIASNEATLAIYPSKASAASDNATVTFQSAYNQSFVYHPGAIAAAIIAPAPFQDGTSSIFQSNGLSMRLSFQKSGLDEIVVVDALVGVKLVHPEGGCVFQG
jgi:hypothetical protein